MNGLSLDEPFFARSFAYFDKDGDDALTARELAASLSQVAGGLGDKGLSYLFYVADYDHDRALSVSELKSFLKDVVDVYCCLVNNVLGAAHNELVAVGVKPAALTAQKQKLAEMQKNNSNTFNLT